MNAPLPDSIRKALEPSRSTTSTPWNSGRAFMSGVQALVRLPMLQRQRDAMARAEHRRLHQRLPRQPAGRLRPGAVAGQEAPAGAEHRVPARRERRTGATAVWGTQQLDLYPQAKQVRRRVRHLVRQGPGRGPLLDVFKHANMAGTSRHGGVIAIAGDDHVAKSSTAAHQSDHIFKACGLPVFFPSTCRTSSTWACTPSR
jgi:indolepyruvate ferredoxin oxidoreductase